MGTHASRPVEEKAHGVFEACLSVPPSPSHSHCDASSDEAAGGRQPQPASTQILSLPDHVLTHNILPRVSNAADVRAFLASCKAARRLDSVHLQANWLEQNKPAASLQLAAGPNGSEALFLQLLGRPAAVAASAVSHRYTHLLCLASAAGYAQAVRRLLLLPGLDASAVGIVEGMGRTALECAAQQGHAHVVRLLLQASRIVEIDTLTLSLATENNHTHVLGELLRHPSISLSIAHHAHSPVFLCSVLAFKKGNWGALLLLLQHLHAHRLCKIPEDLT